MKTLISLPILLLLHFNIAKAQSLKKVTTYYDVFNTKVHETYTTLSTPPYLIHGVYEKYDVYGALMTRGNYSQGKKNGKFTNYFATELTGIYGKAALGKIWSETNYINDKVDGLDKLYSVKNGQSVLIKQDTWVKGEKIKDEAWTDDGLQIKLVQMNGPCYEKYESGQKKAEYTLKAGKYEGKYLSWFQDGKPEVSSNYRDDKKNGKHIEYFKNGQIEFDATFVDDKMSGLVMLYFEDGSTRKRINYDPTTFSLLEEKIYSSKKVLSFDRTALSSSHFKTIIYDSITGVKREEKEEAIDKQTQQPVKDGKAIEFYSDGKISIEANYSMGKLHGSYKNFDKSGELIVSGELNSGYPVGVWMYHYDEKWNKVKSKSEASFFRKIDYGTGSSPWKTTDYYISGEKQFEGTLLNDTPEDLLTGKALFYYKNGKIEKEETYDNQGNLTGKSLAYYPSGKFAQELNYSQNQLSGAYVHYDQDGQVIATGSYKDDNKIGEWVIYLDSTRNLTSQKNLSVYIRNINYKDGQPAWVFKDLFMNNQIALEGSLAEEFPDKYYGEINYYNTAGKVIHKQHYMRPGDLVKEWKYFYSKQGNLVLEGRTDGPEIIWTEYLANGQTTTSYTPISDKRWTDKNYQPDDAKSKEPLKEKKKEGLKALKQIINN